MGFSPDLSDQNMNYIHENIIKNISGNISVLQMICYIYYSEYNDLKLIQVQLKQKAEYTVTFGKNQPQEMKQQMINFIDEIEKKRNDSLKVRKEEDFFTLINYNSE